MYTRCPSCSATFRVTAALLQMAEGDVRCGSCGSVFNALPTLVDDLSPAAGSPPGSAQGAVPEGAPPLRRTPGQAQNVGSGTETLEFNVPETEWQRFFITAAETPPAPARDEPGLGEELADEVPATGDPADPAAEPFDVDSFDEPFSPRSLEEETADTDTWKAFLRETEAQPDTPDAGPAGELGDDAEEDDKPLFVVSDEDLRLAEVLVRHPPEALSRSTEPAAMVSPDSAAAADEPGHEDLDAADEPGSPASANELEPEDTADDGEPDTVPLTTARRPVAGTVLDWDAEPAFPEQPPRAPAHTARWLGLTLVAALALGMQVVHYRRDTLAIEPRVGPLVRAAYERLGLELYPAWPLDSYEIRDAKAIAENSAPGALDIVAEIAVTGPQPVGPPMVRVMLRDRWSNAVASGAFDASNYLAEPGRVPDVYAPGSLIPVQISLRDPGASAQGYELDVCVPNRRLGLLCRSGRDPFRR